MDNKGKTPLVTVIMPIYNNMNTVRQSVDSVLSQTMPDLELFIIDDGSKDNTYEIIKELAEKDQRITILKMNAILVLPLQETKLWI